MKKSSIFSSISMALLFAVTLCCTYGCNDKQPTRSTADLADTIPQNLYNDAPEAVGDTISTPKAEKLYKDTVITYTISDISSEGAEAIVKYIKGDISYAEVRIYGCSFQSKTEYTFSDDKIEARDTIYRYQKPLTEVGDLNEDANIETESYILDYKGIKHISRTDTIPDELFHYFKEVVPFTLYAQ